MKIKLSDFVWEYLAGFGIRHAFMFPGGGAMHLVDSLGKNKKIENITLLHEQACAIATETYSRIHGAIGVCLVTTGPGGTNAMTGVAAAWMESTPCLFISGQVKTTDLKQDSGVRQRGNQEIGIVELVQSITKYAVMVEKPEDIITHLDSAMRLARSGRMGPVWLDIPLDVQAAMIDVPEGVFKSEPELFDIKTDSGALGDEVVSQMRGLLADAKRPILLIGQGVQRAKAVDELKSLLKDCGIPVLTSWLASELVADDLELKIGKPGMLASRAANYALQSCDLLISVGCRLDNAMIGYDHRNFAPKAKKVIVDIDRAEIEKINTKIDIGISMDARRFLSTFHEIVRATEKKAQWEEWREVCVKWKTAYPIVQAEHLEDKNGVNPYHFFSVLSETVTETAVVIPGSSGAGIDAFWMSFQIKNGQRVMATGGLGSMGYGLPAAIGACIASDRRQTICVEGDGSLQLNIQELASVVGLNLPLKIFINDNNGYLSIRNMQKSHFASNFVGSDRKSGLYIPDIRAVAAAYGLKTFEINNHDRLKEKIETVLECDGPVLCCVKMDDGFVIQPKVVSRVTAEGSMESMPLEDLWPFLDRGEHEKNMRFL